MDKKPTYTVQDLIDTLEELPQKHRDKKLTFLDPDFREFEIAPFELEESLFDDVVMLGLNRDGTIYSRERNT